ncbi:MAG: glycosyltransferase family 2 protein [Christensenellales bacterium]
MNKYKVSIIIPVYNCEKYIARCLESIIKQTLKEIEIICINDASGDDSFDILNNYQKKDSRIKIIHMPVNKGAGLCRNKGLELASGEYIHFVDADDYMMLDACEKLYNHMKEKNGDICFHKIKIISENKNNESSVSQGILEKYDGSYIGTGLLDEFVKNNEFFLYPWSVIFKRKLINENKLTFSSLLIGEGGEFVLKALVRAKSASVLDEVLYYYNVHEDSIMGKNSKRSIILLGQISQYIIGVREFAICNNSYGLKNFLVQQKKKIKPTLDNLSKDELENIEKAIKEDFSKYIFYELKNATIEDDLVLDDSITQILEKINSVILYGAGNITKNILKILNFYGIELEAIIVTNRENNPENIYGHKIYQIDELHESQKKEYVLVPLKRRYLDEVKLNLEKNGFKNIICIDISK